MTVNDIQAYLKQYTLLQLSSVGARTVCVVQYPDQLQYKCMCG